MPRLAKVDELSFAKEQLHRKCQLGHGFVGEAVCPELPGTPRQGPPPVRATTDDCSYLAVGNAPQVLELLPHGLCVWALYELRLVSVRGVPYCVLMLRVRVLRL